MISLATPYVLLAIPLAFIPIWLARSHSKLILRTISLVLIILALAGPQISTRRIEHNTLILVDRSASVEAARSALELHNTLDRISSELSDWNLGVIEFASRAHVVSPFGFPPTLSENVPFDVTSSRLKPAVDLALASLPSTGDNHLILISDGQFTDDLSSALGTAQASGIPVSVVFAGGAAPSDVMLADLQAPVEIELDRPFYVEISIDADEPGGATLALYRDNELLHAETVAVEAGRSTLSVEDELQTPGAYTYRAVIRSPRDTIPQNDALSLLVRTTDQAQLLLVDSEEDSPIAAMLSHLGIAFDHEATIPSMEILAGYRQLILSGIPLLDLTTTESSRIETFVQELGGGLLLVEGEAEARGFSSGPITDLLPVSFVLPEKGQEASLAILFLLDRSASMQASADGQVKIETLKEATAASIALLQPDTLAGIIAFNRDYEWVAPVSPVDDGTALYESLRPLDAVGGTDLYPPLVEALDSLEEVEARSKHILLVSDGKTTDEPRDYPSLYARLEETQDVTLTAIAIGGLPNMALLSSLVRSGGGALYRATDFASLPQVSIQATQRISRSRFVTNSTEVAGQLQMLFSETSIPPVGGYLVTYAKATAQILLWANEDPLVAHWRTGLGAVTVLNTDLHGDWSASWIEWPQAPALLDVLLATTEPMAHSTSGLSVVISDGEEQVTVLAEADDDGVFANFMDLEVDVLPLATHLTMEQVGPGAYRAVFPRPDEGGYAVQVTDSSRDRSVTLPLSIPFPEEYRRIGEDTEALAEVARSTGGAVLTDDFTLPAPDRAVGNAARSIARELLLTALGLFLLDLALRKRPRRSRNETG